MSVIVHTHCLPGVIPPNAKIRVGVYPHPSTQEGEQQTKKQQHNKQSQEKPVALKKFRASGF
jgi:hypothetical protein